MHVPNLIRTWEMKQSMFFPSIDLLGSPRVAPFFFDDISMIYVCTCCANRFRPSHFHPDWPIVDPIPRSLYINRRNWSSPIFPIFSHMKVLSILGWLSHMRTFFEPRGPSYGPKLLSSIVFPFVHRKDDPSPPLRSHVETRGLKKKLFPNSTRRPQKPHDKLSLPHFLHPPFKVTIKPQSMHQNMSPTIWIKRRCQF